MTFAIWALIAGVIFTVMALSGTLLKRLPLSTSMLYLLAGFVLGPAGFALLDAISDHRPSRSRNRSPKRQCWFLCLRSALKLTLPLSDRRWRAPLRLATVSMLITIALLAAIGVMLFDLPLGAAILLAAMLAPTDPVLASDVQLEDPNDRDSVRFSLTGEGGLNDGAAFPFVMLGLAIAGPARLGLELLALGDARSRRGRSPADSPSVRCADMRSGSSCCTCARGIKEAVGLDEFLMLGLIGVAYGAAQLAATYGFLAVFAAGLALQRSQRKPASAQAVAVNRQENRKGAGRQQQGRSSRPIRSWPAPT